MLGVDPGLTQYGVGTADAGGAKRVDLVDTRVVRSPVKLAPYKCLLITVGGLQRVIDAFKPDVAAVERVFAQSNIRSVTDTTQVVGIVMLVAARMGLCLVMHMPPEVKAAVTRSGRMDKRQVQVTVQRILGLASLPRPADTANAVTTAIAHF